MDFGDDFDFIEINSQNRKDVLEFIFKKVIQKLKNDSHLKIITLKTKKVAEDKFLKTVLSKNRILDIIQSFLDDSDAPETYILHKHIFEDLIEALVIEWKNRIFSHLTDDGIMGLFYDKDNDKIFWAFTENAKPIRNEKDILKEKKNGKKHGNI